VVYALGLTGGPMRFAERAREAHRPPLMRVHQGAAKWRRCNIAFELAQRAFSSA
jgi:hypothetical protein